MPKPDGALRAILRNNDRSADLTNTHRVERFEIVCVTWGPAGTALYRNGMPVSQKGVEWIALDPGIAALHLGGPGSGSSPRFRGDVGEIRVYNQPLDESDRSFIEAEQRANWFKPSDLRAIQIDLLADLHAELLSARGPFWLPAAQRLAILPPSVQTRLAVLKRDLDESKKSLRVRSREPSPCKTVGPRVYVTKASRTHRSTCAAILLRPARRSRVVF